MVVLVRMKTDIQPRCQVHRESPMAPVEVYGKIDQPYSFRAFACEAPGCHLLYNIIHGYFEISGGRISPLSQFRRPCPNDESPMYLENLEKSGAGTYRCSQFGCDGNRQAPYPWACSRISAPPSAGFPAC